MIINGGARGGVAFWSKHLTSDRENDRAEVVELAGLLATDLPTALREMRSIAAQSRSRGNFLYCANLNPHDDERLTPGQWREAVDTLEKRLGFEGHQRVVVEHEKGGRVHRHVVWNRVNVDTLRVADIGWNYHTHERTARELERRFGLAPTPSLHGTCRPNGRPARPPELWERRAAARGGADPDRMKAELTALWHRTNTGKAFANGLPAFGYILARGDRHVDDAEDTGEHRQGRVGKPERAVGVDRYRDAPLERGGRSVRPR